MNNLEFSIPFKMKKNIVYKMIIKFKLHHHQSNSTFIDLKGKKKKEHSIDNKIV